MFLNIFRSVKHVHKQAATPLQSSLGLSRQLLDSICCMTLRIVQKTAYHYLYTPIHKNNTHTHKNTSCITLIVCYSLTMARSGYIKIPRRQMHYKNDSDRVKGGKRKTPNDGEDKENKARKG
ncbi:hypothetical protein AMECASPLE_035731 [Ameca splendens]|uniref:Uncharacterized protein n=1 Tax=Ameca splendens TaxID=208324 RepID=A0ABV0Z5F5_9TELE